VTPDRFIVRVRSVCGRRSDARTEARRSKEDAHAVLPAGALLRHNRLNAGPPTRIRVGPLIRGNKRDQRSRPFDSSARLTRSAWLRSAL
jgi:hypothetical protein